MVEVNSYLSIESGPNKQVTMWSVVFLVLYLTIYCWSMTPQSDILSDNRVSIQYKQAFAGFSQFDA